jgi:hypothetical protein
LQELIDIGVRQGAVIGFPEGTTEKLPSFKTSTTLIQKGRFGESQIKGVTLNSRFVILTQDCTIANQSKYIELTQLKKLKEQDEDKIKGLLLGKDYSKIILKIDEKYYQAEETLITKLKKSDLHEIINNGDMLIQTLLPNRSIKILLDWRVLAYLREPFPDKFNKFLLAYLKDSQYWFADFLLEHQDDIHSIRIFVTPEDDENAAQYQFAISALLTELGGLKQDKIEKQIDRMLHEFGLYEGIDCIQTIDLDTDTINLPEHLILSLALTLDEFSFANAYVMREFNFQYLCY